ncbi:MAG: hypothetical protein JO033_28325 [Acidobacteriaceae bacterium]|nr:hypothetical protein [Acidobacteriaceae bacterium]MBV9497920.1 hypothetical protein [Acidobacteriaceae bacterium]
MHVLEPAWDLLKREFDAACRQSAQAAQRQTVYNLNQFVRRVHQYRTQSEWVLAVVDAASKFVAQVAVFSLMNDTVNLRGQQNLDLPADLSFSLKAAGAFASAVDSKDPVVALRTPGEVTDLLSTSDVSDRAHLFPIVNGSRVVALMFAADPEYVDANALELIAGIGSALLERQVNTALHAQIAAAPMVASQAPAVQPEHSPAPANGALSAGESVRTRTLPAWADLSEDQRALHIKAQRFSRVAVAEMQLHRPEVCRAGREQNNLYLFLKTEIEKARATYRKQFITIPSMVDYLHIELVRTAAEGNEQKLGADYPGPLV